MTEVTKDQFFSYVNPRDVISSFIKNTSPFESEYRLRYGAVIGKTVEIGKQYPYEEKFYLTQNALNQAD